MAPTTAVPISRARRKMKGSRVRLTHLEVRRGGALRLRVAIADDVLAEFGDELGALIHKIAPATQGPHTHEPEPDVVVSREHPDDDVAYHADVRTRLTELISSLCDTSLADVLEIAREERARRAEGAN